jgi:hypothetical protein
MPSTGVRLLFEKGHCLVAMEGELAKQKTLVSTSPFRFIIEYHYYKSMVLK